jgi:2-polyprenyl-6-methoxyphenol hydroxylase-like FAD-dependent oxidoreductase
MTDEAELKIAIIGAGPAGIAAGRELHTKGFRNFTIFDAMADDPRSHKGIAHPTSPIIFLRWDPTPWCLTCRILLQRRNMSKPSCA